MKIFRTINKEKYVFDFLINVRSSNFYYDEIKHLGGEIYYGYPKSKHPLKSFLSVRKIVKEGQYKIVFCIAVHPIGFLDLLASKMGGAKLRIIRSTNSTSGGLLSRICAKVCRPFVQKFASWMVAPSTEAGLWLCGEKGIHSNSFIIIPNGVEPPAYEYKISDSEKIKKELNIAQNTTVIGHVGRFNAQKNHNYLIDVFYQYRKKNNNSVLLLVGTGELMESVRKRVEALNIQDYVKFLGRRNDVASIMASMDVLVMPSLYEGMPNVVIEAQTNGLKCLVSDTITKEVGITDLITYKSISDEPRIWADSIGEMLSQKNKPREKYVHDIIAKGYAISYSSECLEKIFDEVM